MLFLLRQHNLFDDGDDCLVLFLCTIGVFDVGVRMLLLRFIFGLVVAEDDADMCFGVCNFLRFDLSAYDAMFNADCERLIAFNGVMLRRWCCLLLLYRYGVVARTNSDDLFRGVNDNDDDDDALA
jgi:hypothetical protein